MFNTKAPVHRTARVLCHLALALSALSAPASCGRVAPGGTDSNTHWLERCETDADCGASVCLCGTCTKACADDSVCTGLPGASCQAPDCASGAVSQVCAAPCDDDADCRAIRSGLACDNGLCREPNVAAGGAGAGGGGGMSGSGGHGGATGSAAAAGTTGGACACSDPACIEDKSWLCMPPACPPTLADELDYDVWPHEPNGARSVSYQTCDDGTARFTVIDPFGENPFWMTFDVEGNLAFVGNVLKADCGTLTTVDPGTQCRGCEVVREGGLEQVGGGAGGAGGEGGAPSSNPTPSGVTYCLVDENNQLVMPSAGPPSAGTCDAMRVGDTGEPCTSPARYYWNGSFCMPFMCDTCVGEDCGDLFSTADECDEVYALCYLINVGESFSQECEIGADCELQIRGCCGSCGTNSADNLISVNVAAEEGVMSACSLTPCPACVSSIDPNVYATCVNGRCSVAYLMN